MIAILGLTTFLVVSLTILPLLVLIVTSFRPTGVLWLEKGGFTVDNFINLVTQPSFITLVNNTVIYVGGTILLATIFATLWAWITERTNFKYKVSVRVMMIVTLSLPTLIQGFGWILLLNPSNGYINVLLRSWFGIEGLTGPIDIYSLELMIFVSSFLLTPTIYVMLSGIIKNLDYRLEFPANLAGVPFYKTLYKVLIPILLPGLLSVLIYTIMIMIQVFEIPLTIGLTGGIQVLSTRIYLLSTAELGEPNYNSAAAFGVLLTIVAVILVVIYQKLTSKSERFSIVGGKGFRFQAKELGRYKYVVYLYSIVFFFIAFMPVMILFWASLLPFYVVPSVESLSRLSFSNYANLFESSMFLRGLVNTAIVVIIGATLTMIVSALIAYLTVRTKSTLSRIVEILAFAPIAIPNIVLGLAVLLLYVRTPIYGTILAIMLAQILVNMAFGSRILAASMIQIHPELERAAEISGVSKLNVIFRIVLPLIRTQVFNGWLLVFAHAMRDVGIPLIFLTSNTVMLSSALWLMWGYPDIPGASALAILLVVVLAIVVTPLQIYMAKVDAKSV